MEVVLGEARAVVFTDLDGTLLDSTTYEPSEEAIAIVDRMARERIPTIAVTSKTASEVRRLRGIVEIAPVAVVEGGAVLLTPADEVVPLGPPRRELVEILRELERSGHAVRGLSAMGLDEVVERTGLSREAARRALEREASEPFVFLTGPGPSEVEEVKRVARAHGASVARGDRLWHLAGAGVDKGRAVRAVLERFPELAVVPAAGIGDAWNDLPMLCQVEHRYLLGSAVADDELDCAVIRIPEAGPGGFVQACLHFLGRLGIA